MKYFRKTICSLVILIFSQSLMALESVSSPDGNIVFSVSSNDKKWLVYSVKLKDETVIAESRLGLRFKEQEGLDSGLEIQTDRQNTS